MKTERNAPCPCGSGLKYKKCCNGKSSDLETSIKMSADSLLSVIAFGLEHGGTLAGNTIKVNVKTVLFANGGDTLLVDFYAQHSKSNDIKG